MKRTSPAKRGDSMMCLGRSLGEQGSRQLQNVSPIKKENRIAQSSFHEFHTVFQDALGLPHFPMVPSQVARVLGR